MPTSGASKSVQDNSPEILTVDLRVVETARRPRTNGVFRSAITSCEVIADLLTIVFSIVLGYAVYCHLGLGKHVHYGANGLIGAALGFAIVTVLMLDRGGAYSRGNSLLRVRETELVLRVSAQAFLIALAFSFSSGFLFS